MPFVAFSENIFKEGTKWITLYWGFIDPPAYVTHTVEGTVTVDGAEALQIYSIRNDDESSRTQIPLMKTEGDKVFFLDPESNNWLLCYDFGLEVGQGCYVYSIPIGNNSAYRSYVKCLRIYDSEEYNGLTVIEFEEFDNDECTGHSETGIWLKGIASVRGLVENNLFGTVGGVHQLVYASTTEGVIYENEEASASEISIDGPSVSVSTNGLEITVSGANLNENVSLYTVDGILIASGKPAGGTLSLTAPHKGIYIVRAGGVARKIAVH